MIKCTFIHQHKYTKEIAMANDYHIHFMEGEIKLKETSSWYTQIQTQLFVTDKRWCDFVLFTKKDILVDRIYFNQQFMDKCVEKAGEFVSKFLIVNKDY